MASGGQVRGLTPIPALSGHKWPELTPGAPGAAEAGTSLAPGCPVGDVPAPPARPRQAGPALWSCQLSPHRADGGPCSGLLSSTRPRSLQPCSLRQAVSSTWTPPLTGRPSVMAPTPVLCWHLNVWVVRPWLVAVGWVLSISLPTCSPFTDRKTVRPEGADTRPMSHSQRDTVGPGTQGCSLCGGGEGCREPRQSD